MGLRFILQACAMIGDLLILAAITIVLTYGWYNPIVWLIVLLTISTWRKQGGLMAWRKKDRNMFLNNAKHYGL